MIAKIKYNNNDIVTIEKTDVTLEQMLNRAQKEIQRYYSAHKNSVEIDGEVRNFRLMVVQI